MIQRRAKAAGIETRIGTHTFRATGITIYLLNGRTLEKAQQMAALLDPEQGYCFVPRHVSATGILVLSLVCVLARAKPLKIFSRV